MGRRIELKSIDLRSTFSQKRSFIIKSYNFMVFSPPDTLRCDTLISFLCCKTRVAMVSQDNPNNTLKSH